MEAKHGRDGDSVEARRGAISFSRRLLTDPSMSALTAIVSCGKDRPRLCARSSCQGTVRRLWRKFAYSFD